jgi:nucleoside-diphosphate-sugar epimerase
MPPTVDTLIFGCGYIGLPVARELISRGHSCAAVTRSRERGTQLASAGITPLIADVCDPASLASLSAAKRVLWAVGYDRASPHSKEAVYVAGLGHALAAVKPHSPHVVYISSTSVWGFDDGRWVDETTPIHPTNEGGRICAAAEEMLQQHIPLENRTILRLAGIYGPGRLLAKAEALQKGEPLAGSGDAWLNLIHQTDAARLATRLLLEGGPEVVLGVDHEPVRRTDYYSELARLIAAPPPTFDESVTPKRGTGGLNKRCRSTHTEHRDYRFASYREGLVNGLVVSE